VNTYLLLKAVHVVSACVPLGTGAGIAFFMWRAHATRDAATVAAVARIVVLADFCFTAPAVLVQFASGTALAIAAGFPLSTPWLAWAIGLFFLVGACWLPVVWLQLRARNLAAQAAREGGPLPAAYHRVMRWRFGLGWPAFAAVLAIVWLMIAKPAI
jgi:uncharacterized membrane protein